MRRSLVLTLVAVAFACGEPRTGADVTPPPPKPPDKPVAAKPPPQDADPSAPGKKEVQAPLKAEQAPAASERLPSTAKGDELARGVQTFFAGRAGERIHVQVDKPLYKPGETIWIKTWDLRARDLGGAATAAGITYELVSPKGAVVLKKRVQQTEGRATNDLELPEGVQGGEYQLRAVTDAGHRAERPVIVSTYEAPRLKKKLEFVRKAYGAGDEVTATIEVKRPTGEPLANRPLTAVIRLDGQDLPRVQLTTNAEGGGLVRFQLPAQIEIGDGLLTVLAEDGGVTESVSKSIPIVLKKVQLAFFPEGGRLVEGLPSRLYFEAKNPLGKPADVEGRVLDDLGNPVAQFMSHRDGLGRFEFTPATGRTYQAEITRPVGVTERYTLPLPDREGCVLRSFDDLDGELAALRASVRCTDARKVLVVGMIRENLLDQALVQVPASAAAVVHLAPKDEALARAQGVARITVFTEDLQPLAERLVYRNRRNRLQVKVEPDRKGYAPRDQVTLTVTTADAAGAARPAELALSVVDDTVVSFADDKTGHMLSRLFLEPELPGKVEEPNFYFDLTEAKSALAMDLLVGTRGFRRFEWQEVLRPPVPAPTTSTTGAMPRAVAEGAEEPDFGPPLRALEKRKGGAMDDDRAKAPGAPPPAPKLAAAPRPAATPPPPPAKAAAPMELAAKTLPAQPARDPAPEAKAEAKANKDWAAGKKEAPAAEPMDKLDAAKPMGRAEAGERRQRAFDEELGGLGEADVQARGDADWKQPVGREANLRAQAQVAFEPVRVFPAPSYAADYAGPRTDFRETIHWAPTVHTGKDGKATVSFYLSDAVTSFRVFAEGVGGGLAGREEAVVKSSLPFSMSVKLPLEVSAGDKLKLPLTLSNEREKALDVSLSASFGELLAVQGQGPGGTRSLAAGRRDSLFYDVLVTGTAGKSQVRFAASAGGLSDEFTREVVVTPVGFPQVAQLAGEVKGKVSHELDLGAAVPGTVDASVRVYPSPVATMVSGLDGMLREPNGCFEQTSSSNYPNIMVLQYLKSHDVQDPKLLERANRLLDSGYKKLVGFESPRQGYEWFGGDPGHEALTAYGLQEFADMQGVYPEVDRQMLVRTAGWLKGRRDGKGGYQRDPKAIDSFGRAAPEVTNAYITWSLTEAGEAGIDAELAVSAKLAQEAADPYQLALAANTLLNVPARRQEGQAAAKRLASLQGPAGSFPGASHSITRSGGANLEIETTSLAVLALLKAGGNEPGVRRAIEWLQKNRGGFGQWGATQATVLALKAMTRYDQANRQTPTGGSVTVLVNGKVAAETAYEAGRREPIVLANLGAHFVAGKNRVELIQEGGSAMPYSVAVEYRTQKPASSPQAAVDLSTRLDRAEVKMGENVRLNATVTNRTAQGQPMTLARIGLPGGLTFQTWQLKELREKGLIAFYETRPREVILYFRDLKPSEVKAIPIDLVATVPGEYVAPASSAYLYYTDEHKTWVDPVRVLVTP